MCDITFLLPGRLLLYETKTILRLILIAHLCKNNTNNDYKNYIRYPMTIYVAPDFIVGTTRVLVQTFTILLLFI